MIRSDLSEGIPMTDPTRLTVDFLFLKASAEGTIPVVFVFTLTLLVLAVFVWRRR